MDQSIVVIIVELNPHCRSGDSQYAVGEVKRIMTLRLSLALKEFKLWVKEILSQTLMNDISRWMEATIVGTHVCCDFSHVCRTTSLFTRGSCITFWMKLPPPNKLIENKSRPQPHFSGSFYASVHFYISSFLFPFFGIEFIFPCLDSSPAQSQIDSISFTLLSRKCF